MRPDQIAEAVDRTFSFGWILYLGLAMALNPQALVRASERFQDLLNGFHAQWYGAQRRPIRGIAAPPLSTEANAALRAMGMAMAALAFFAIAR